MEPFNLEKALKGEKVVTKDGREVTQLHLFDAQKSTFPLRGVLDGQILAWKSNGIYKWNGNTENDLFMAPKKRKYWVNIYRSETGLICGPSYPSMEVAVLRITKDGYNYEEYLKTIKIHEEEI